MSSGAAVNSFSGMVNTAANTFTNIANNATKVVNQAVNQVAPAINSVLPFGTPANTPKRNNLASSNGAKNASGLTPLANTFSNVTNGAAETFSNVTNGAANVVTNMANTVTNTAANAVNGAMNAVNGAVNTAINTVANGKNIGSNLNVKQGGTINWLLIVFIFIVLLLMIIFSVFSNEIKMSYETLVVSLKGALGLSTTTEVQSQITPIEGDVKEVTTSPEAPQDMLPAEKEVEQGLVEKILPIGSNNEVFNVAQNKFTFYDAEPLCRALGAELATYDQIREAWSKGADWCNYGWVKGQMAVYPTQKSTYEKLQSGIPEERASCGTIGLNGGYFDNPELRYGVNCYGKKPSQSTHDERMLMEQGNVPRSPEALSVDKLAAEFRAQRDSLFIRPFNDSKWKSS